MGSKYFPLTIYLTESWHGNAPQIMRRHYCSVPFCHLLLVSLHATSHVASNSTVIRHIVTLDAAVQARNAGLADKVTILERQVSEQQQVHEAATAREAQLETQSRDQQALIGRLEDDLASSRCFFGPGKVFCRLAIACASPAKTSAKSSFKLMMLLEPL